MFIDKEWKKETSKIPDSPEEEKKKNYVLYAIIGIASAIAFLAIFLMRDPIQKGITEVINGGSEHGEKVATSTIGLPQDSGNGDESQYLIGTSTQSIKAEDLTFGHFYEKSKDDFRSSLNNYALPLNVKTDVSNYYEIARKINLDPYVDSLNQNGFAIMDAPASLKNGDFFSAYKFLLDSDIPVAMTEDFLFYYYQNTLKQVFKEIEKNSFYENVWDINKKLYDISLARYKKSLTEYGTVNDPAMEAERAELAYFAVALKLLEPTKDQINPKDNFSDNTRFTLQESEEFSFEMPDYLRSDVDREVALIRTGKEKTKSPVLLFQRNYNEFFVPVSYKENAKLNNFYLTLKWLNTVFPLYHRTEECSDCLLDKDDWIINMATAASISKDFYENQDLKNQWAIIYKFISFFSGLRSDLTYLNYYNTYSDLFGKDYNLRAIFSRENKNRDKNLSAVRDRLLQFNFSDLEGGLSRTDTADRPRLGMRILQEAYWPNLYVMNQLVGKDMINDSVAEQKGNVTLCQGRYEKNFYRCSGFSYDILNLICPVTEKFDYFYNNTNYSNYENKINKLRQEIDRFDIYSWNNNIYWMTLNIARSLVYDNRDDRPVYTQSKDWLKQRDYNTFLGAWTNLHLTDDFFVSYYENADSNLGTFKQCNKYNYIEPNLDFINDLITRNNMLVKMLTILEANKKTSTAAAALKELNKKLAQVADISKKELSNQVLSDDDCRFISDIIKQQIEDKGARSFTLEFGDDSDKRIMRESIEGVKLLGVVYQYEGKKILIVGPIYNFKENGQ